MPVSTAPAASRATPSDSGDVNVSASSIGGAAARLDDRFDVGRIVHAGEVLVGRLAGREQLATGLHPALGHDLHGLGALDPFRVAGRREVVGESIAGDQNQ